MEANLVKLLEGQSLDEVTSDLCDYTLEEQNAFTEAQGIQPSARSDYVPILGSTVTYVVACVILNEANEVLMIQEAKKSCSGKWYLPAGLVDKNENIVVAAMMEVLEESGFRVDVKTLLAVESAGGSWFRFVFTGEIVGGELKTPAQADKESIQAKWSADPQKELPLRANDILPIIEIGRTHHNRNPKDTMAWHKNILPAKKSHHKSYLRLIIGIKKKSTNRVSILLSEKTEYHFPICELHPGKSVHSTLRKFLIELFGAELPQHKPVGLLSVEHCPGNMDSVMTSDGLCLTLLVIVKPSIEEVSLIGKCAWHELSKELGDRLAVIAASKNSTIPLIVIR